jgi:DNA-directed RNA polymerase specialized sigma24 family protein
MPSPDRDAELLALDEALDRLAATNQRLADLVSLRYFAGMTVPQAAAVLGISPRTADAWWAYARAWLAADLAGQ